MENIQSHIDLLQKLNKKINERGLFLRNVKELHDKVNEKDKKLNEYCIEHYDIKNPRSPMQIIDAFQCSIDRDIMDALIIDNKWSVTTKGLTELANKDYQIAKDVLMLRQSNNILKIFKRLNMKLEKNDILKPETMLNCFNKIKFVTPEIDQLPKDIIPQLLAKKNKETTLYAFELENLGLLTFLSVFEFNDLIEYVIKNKEKDIYENIYSFIFGEETENMDELNELIEIVEKLVRGVAKKQITGAIKHINYDIVHNFFMSNQKYKEFSNKKYMQAKHGVEQVTTYFKTILNTSDVSLSMYDLMEAHIQGTKSDIISHCLEQLCSKLTKCNLYVHAVINDIIYFETTKEIKENHWLEIENWIPIKCIFRKIY